MKVFSDSGEIIGRKKLQKMIYIAKKMQFPFYEKYDFHFYTVFGGTDAPDWRAVQPWISAWGEGKKGGYFQYRYSLTETGSAFLDHADLDMPDMKGYIDSVNSRSSRFLELVSTILYFDGLEDEEKKEKVFTIKSKQKYTNEEYDEALQYIEELKQIC